MQLIFSAVMAIMTLVAFWLLAGLFHLAGLAVPQVGWLGVLVLMFWCGFIQIFWGSIACGTFSEYVERVGTVPGLILTAFGLAAGALIIYPSFLAFGVFIPDAAFWAEKVTLGWALIFGAIFCTMALQGKARYVVLVGCLVHH